MISRLVLAASALVLPGCATTPRLASASAATGCLPPVDVSAERVIRTAGLPMVGTSFNPRKPCTMLRELRQAA